MSSLWKDSASIQNEKRDTNSKINSLSEPYLTIGEVFGMNTVQKIEQKLKGRQLKFNKNAEDSLRKYPELCDLLGTEDALTFAKHFANEVVYFHAIAKMSTIERDERVQREFNGYNHAELAEKYNCTERNIYKIIAKSRNLKGEK